MEKNKTVKYFKYAFGEIILVVFGILIALQINNWNEIRKLKAKELEILLNFKESLKVDSLRNAESDQFNSMGRNSMDYLVDYMNKDLPYKDSLKYHFGIITMDWPVKFDFSTYDVLKSNDLNLISNKKLRSDITRYYTYLEGQVLIFTKRYSTIIDNAAENILIKHFDQMWSGRMNDLNINELVPSEMIPNDFEALKKDKEFRYFLKTLKNQNYWLLKVSNLGVSNYLNNLSVEIDKEIGALKK